MTRKRTAPTVVRALEEARFGPNGLLNLRDSMPSEAEATTRAESWLRERQVMGIDEVLIITGRGLGSPGGIGIVRAGVRKLLSSLKRRGVINTFSENGPGSFLVQVAPLRKLFEAARRNVDRRNVAGAQGAGAPSASLSGLTPQQQKELRLLAELSLRSLGVAPDEQFLQGEMERQFSILAASLAGGKERERLLAEAISRAIREYEDG